jgi:hypothetical protein
MPAAVTSIARRESAIAIKYGGAAVLASLLHARSDSVHYASILNLHAGAVEYLDQSAADDRVQCTLPANVDCSSFRDGNCASGEANSICSFARLTG